MQAVDDDDQFEDHVHLSHTNKMSLVYTVIQILYSYIEVII